MPNYSQTAARVVAQIKRAGAPCVLTRSITTDYDPNFAEPVEERVDTFRAYAVRAQFGHGQIDGTRILATDVRVLISPDLGTIPEPGDKVLFDGVTYNIVRPMTHRPSDITVAHDVQCRA